MFSTVNGVRIATGAEAELIRQTAAVLADAIRAEKEIDVPIPTDINVFSSLSPDQKMYCLRVVTEALLVPEIEPPPKVALYEGTVAAIYEQLSRNLEDELYRQTEEQDAKAVDTFNRKLLSDAATQLEPDQVWPHPECVLEEEWDQVITSVQFSVLGDYDWEMEVDFLDMKPQEAKMKKTMLGIDNDYYVAIPPDDAELDPESDLRRMIELTHD